MTAKLKLRLAIIFVLALVASGCGFAQQLDDSEHQSLDTAAALEGFDRDSNESAADIYIGLLRTKPCAKHEGLTVREFVGDHVDNLGADAGRVERALDEAERC